MIFKPNGPLHAIAHAVEEEWGRLKHSTADALGLTGTPMIAPYHGFGTTNNFWVRARVLEDEGVTTAIHSDALWHNIRHTFKRYESDEIANARIRWQCGDQTGEVVTNSEGFVDLTFDPGTAFDPDAPWHDVHLELLDAPGYDTVPLGATVRVRTPSAKAGSASFRISTTRSSKPAQPIF